MNSFINFPLYFVRAAARYAIITNNQTAAKFVADQGLLY